MQVSCITPLSLDHNTIHQENQEALCQLQDNTVTSLCCSGCQQRYHCRRNYECLDMFPYSADESDKTSNIRYGHVAFIPDYARPPVSTTSPLEVLSSNFPQNGIRFCRSIVHSAILQLIFKEQGGDFMICQGGAKSRVQVISPVACINVYSSIKGWCLISALIEPEHPFSRIFWIKRNITSFT